MPALEYLVLTALTIPVTMPLVGVKVFRGAKFFLTVDGCGYWQFDGSQGHRINA